MLRGTCLWLLTPALLLGFCGWLSAAPPVIADLTPGGTTSASVELTWTVSGGEPATVYDLRCSTAPITSANFADALPDTPRVSTVGGFNRDGKLDLAYGIFSAGGEEEKC